MTIRRLDNVLVVVDDLDAVVAFFVALGMEVEGRTRVSGEWAGRVIGLADVDSDIVVLRTPDGHGRVELTKFHRPEPVVPEPLDAPANTLGLRRIMFAVDAVEETVERVRAHGAELVGEIVRYEDAYRLCYVRGPEGIVVGLAEELR